jgi:hypothetical protein
MHMKNRFFLIPMVLVLLAGSFFAGCASSPSGTAQERPDWVVSPPADTSEDVFFVGAGSHPDGDSAAARQAATSDLVAGITRFLGVRVTAETTVEARDTLDTFTTSLEQVIREQSAAQIGDFRIRDTYSETVNGVANVYILAAYNKDSLLKEQARLRALFAEQEEAISGPEAEGDALAAAGQWYRAAVKYMEAALAASSSELDNAAIRFERNMNKARNAVSSINLEKVNDNLTASLYQPFSEQFRVRVVSSSGPMADVPVRFTYKRLGRNNRILISYETLRSNANGIAAFTPPPPDFVGRETMAVNLDFSDALGSLENISNALFPQLEALEAQIRTNTTSFTYTVESRAKEIPTAVMVIDVDNAANPTGRTESAAGLLEALSSQGFMVGTVAPQQNLQGSSDAAIIRNAAAAHGDRYGRLIFGTVGLSEHRESDGRHTVRVSGDVKVADLETGDILYSSGNQFRTAMGNNVNSAMSAAFRQFGKMVGESMVNALP